MKLSMTSMGVVWAMACIALAVAGDPEPLVPLPAGEAPGDEAAASAGGDGVVVLEPLASEEPSLEQPAVEKVVVLEPLPLDQDLFQTVLDERLIAVPEEASQLSFEEAARRVTDEVFETVTRWAEAWSEQAVDRYLAHYASGFKVPGGRSRRQWEEERRQRISRPSAVEVEVSFEGEPHRLAPGRVLVSFRQQYTSELHGDVVTKTLELVRENRRWMILEEIAGN